MAHDYFPSVSGKEGGFDRPLTALPYCEGDYWPGMAETFSQQLKDGSFVNVPLEKRTNPHLEGVATALGPPLASAQAPRVSVVKLEEGAESCNTTTAVKDGGVPLAAPEVSVLPTLFPGLAVVAATQLHVDVDTPGFSGGPGGGGGGQKGKKGKGRGAGVRGGRAGAVSAAASRGGGIGMGARIHSSGNLLAGCADSATLASAAGRRDRDVVLGPDGKALAYDPVRDKIAELLTGSMERDFIIVKLRPSCQLCKRYITGGVNMRVMHRCKLCYQQVSVLRYSHPLFLAQQAKECFVLRPVGASCPCLIHLCPIIPGCAAVTPLKGSRIGSGRGSRCRCCQRRGPRESQIDR